MASVDEVIRELREFLTRRVYYARRYELLDTLDSERRPDGLNTLADALSAMQEENARLRSAIEAALAEHDHQCWEWNDAEWGDPDQAAYHAERAAILRRALSIQDSPEGQEGE